MKIKGTLISKMQLQTENDPALMLNNEPTSEYVMSLRDNRLIIPGSDKLLYPMLAIEINIEPESPQPNELIIISYCPKTNVSTPWIRFSIPVHERSMTIDLWECMKMSDCKDPEAVGYYSWHYTDGLYFSFNSEEQIKYQVNIHIKEALK